MFFGLDPGAELALQIADWRDRQFPGAGRPVPPANLHITLAFIGELRERDLESLALGVEHWLERRDPGGAVLNLDQTGYWHRPGIYWLGPSAWPAALDQLARKLRHLATSAGGKRDRNRFLPHLTLFRNCEHAPPAPSLPPDFTFGYDHFTLYESRQGRRGVSYHALADWPLAPGVGNGADGGTG
jgi:2'-5' RNA ligase